MGEQPATDHENILDDAEVSFAETMNEDDFAILNDIMAENTENIVPQTEAVEKTDSAE